MAKKKNREKFRGLHQQYCCTKEAIRYLTCHPKEGCPKLAVFQSVLFFKDVLVQKNNKGMVKIFQGEGRAAGITTIYLIVGGVRVAQTAALPLSGLVFTRR